MVFLSSFRCFSTRQHESCSIDKICRFFKIPDNFLDQPVELPNAYNSQDLLLVSGETKKCATRSGEGKRLKSLQSRPKQIRLTYFLGERELSLEKTDFFSKEIGIYSRKLFRDAPFLGQGLENSLLFRSTNIVSGENVSD